MLKRTIELTLSDDFFTNSNLAEAEKTIGYLSHWAISGGRFSRAKIVGDSEGNVTGLYLKDDGSLGYEIFGLKREDGTYSFHS